MREAYKVESRFLKPHCIPVVRIIRQGSSDEGMFIMPVCAVRIKSLSVYLKALLPCDLYMPYPDIDAFPLKQDLAADHICLQFIEVRMQRVPELRML